MRVRWISTLFALLAFGLLAFWLSRTVRELVRQPGLDRETLLAMGLALEWEERDPLLLHERTLAVARLELDPATLLALTSGPEATDPARFQAELAARRGSIAYSVAVRLLHEQGLALSAATWWVSLGCFAFLALLFLGWSAEYLPLGWSFLATLALTHAPELVAQANRPGPHVLAGVCLAFGAWALLARRLFPVAAGLFLLGLAAEPETIWLSLFLGLALLVGARGSERPNVVALLLWLALSVALWFALGTHAAGQGLRAFCDQRVEGLQALLAAGRPALALSPGLESVLAGVGGAATLLAGALAARRGRSATVAFAVALLLGGILCAFGFGGGLRLLPFLETLVPFVLLSAVLGRNADTEGRRGRASGTGSRLTGRAKSRTT